MDRFMAYLRIPSHYAAGMKGLHWAPEGDAIQFSGGSTFAFPFEIFSFLEGYLSQRPLIHFAHIIHLLYLLKELRTPFLGKQEGVLAQVFSLAERPYRNAGVFCAVLCADIPPVPDPPPTTSMDVTFSLDTSDALFTMQNGDMPALPGEVFEARVLHALSAYSFEEILHWFRYGRGSVRDAGEEIADTLVLDKPRSLHGVLADLSQLPQLSGARPFVDQLVSALTLPPRRLEKPELPLGGYSDVSTRGQVEQLLPSQFVFDDLEFVRRHAERELLYFHREDPHVRTREDLVVLLDQGVRVWGAVRLVLTAALFALGRLAERRRIPFLVAATSGGGELLDPLEADATELQELIECCDLSPHPGPALERVLSEETDMARDVVLLTHPRNLGEPAVIAASRQLRSGARLFAVAVDEHGGVCFSEVRGGVPLPLNRFHVDLQRTAPPPTPAIADPLTAWRGDVEPVPFPFRFGLSNVQKPIHLAFDAAGEWLLVATRGGMLHATRTDGSRNEILPRGLVENTIVSDVAYIIGVAGGFVLVSDQPQQVLAFHYDFIARVCTAHRFEKRTTADTTASTYFVKGNYVRKQHLLLLDGHRSYGSGAIASEYWCLHLSTGDRTVPPFVQKMMDWRSGGAITVVSKWAKDSCVLSTELQLDDLDQVFRLPHITLDAASGEVRIHDVSPAWEKFTPLADNTPVLKGWKLWDAACRGQTVAAFFTKPGESSMLRLFRGPAGIPLAAYQQSHTNNRFALSDDGCLLALQLGRGQVQIRDVSDGNRIFHVLAAGRFHPQLQVVLGELWMTIRIDHTVHLIRWNSGALVMKAAYWPQSYVAAALQGAGLPEMGVAATLGGRPPDFLPLDPGRRFGPTANNNLLAVVSRFGEVALFERTGELVCMFFAFRKQIAVWMPDGTCHGPMSLLGRPATPGALEKIGDALRAAWERGIV